MLRPLLGDEFLQLLEIRLRQFGADHRLPTRRQFELAVAAARRGVAGADTLHLRRRLFRGFLLRHRLLLLVRVFVAACADADLRAQVVQDARGALRSAGGAGVAAVQHHCRAESDPLVLWHRGHQVLFDLVRVVVVGQAQPLTDAGHVCIDDDATGDLVGVGQHHVRRLAGHRRQGQQVVHVARHLAAVAIHQRPAGVLDRLGLVTVVAGWPHHLFQLPQVRVGEGGRVGVLREQRRRHAVDALVGTLRRQDGRHQQLQGVLPVQLVARVRVGLAQPVDDGG